MNDKTVYRVKKDTNFIVMNKTGLQDKQLSWKAKGLLAYMLSMPDNWKFHNEELATHSPEGVGVIKSAIKELKERGYVVREPIRDEKGKVKEWGTFVYEVPQAPEGEKPPLDDKRPEVKNPPTGETSGWENHPVENRPLLNNDLSLSNDFTEKDRLIDSKQEHAQEDDFEPTSKPKGDGIPITAPGAVQEEISPTDRFNKIEQHYIMRRGGFCLNGKDSKAITEILKEGISSETIIAGIDRAFDTYEPKYSGDKIRAFSYCSTVIRQMHYEKTEREKALRDVERFNPDEGSVKPTGSTKPHIGGKRGYQNQRKDELPPLIREQIERQQRMAAGEFNPSEGKASAEDTDEKKRRVQELLKEMGEVKA
ncbi:helix-turn-helix domain-containing protein [Aneurinibacillus migulanus]|uniref:Helix-turn-helix domain-containing protein n=1 Tax=Aneurinibacillus migulanus TaxID=47500 RepID=A0A1G8WJ90_ANEMI|nr:hypothetical protein [Aneurinibacillus migulanus]MED0894942.1 hypothetical protein [Aneurinibacillus migulanus]MED1614415.1 hypothetical protein [Aneurinibacillus migulanus]GED14829.1 hypothetical protein AMI01nite_28200 [Aneurinibacillus migulanus]SDJ78429.1 hypothetical protein SAMN04487909_12873 [Aneurinibacillus migulanus]